MHKKSRKQRALQAKLNAATLTLSTKYLLKTEPNDMTDQALEAMMADAARYALVRRLGPLLRHNVAGAVQPLSLISMLMEKRLASATPDLDALRKSSAQLGAMAREASSTCLGVMAWLAPGASDRLTASAGVDEVVNLVRTELNFKGFTLSNQVESVQTEVPLSLTRHVFLAALLALTRSEERRVGKECSS